MSQIYKNLLKELKSSEYSLDKDTIKSEEKKVEEFKFFMIQ